MIYDIHCHLDLYENEEEVKKVIENARKNKVKCIITNSVDLTSCKKNLEYTKKYIDIVKLAVGFYPKDALERENEDIEKRKKRQKESFENLEEFALKNKKYVFAIGEVGLDLYKGKNLEEQKELLKKELILAEELNVPVILHSRKAEKEIIEFTKDFKCKKILHCFNGKFSLIKNALSLGYYFSIPTNIVKLEHFKEMIKILPKEKILTETDAPYLSPYAGKKNEPSFIKETIKVIAKVLDLSEEETEKILWNNFVKVFDYKNTK
ncbi:MAG: TatD family hydrolase [Candidatus Pacearchaeota archaeon]